MAAPVTSFGDMKSQLAAFMRRDMSEFVVNGVDLLSKAVYRARTYAQQKHDFEVCRCAVTIPSMSIANGALLSTAVRYGTTEPVSVKAIEAAFLPVPVQGSSTNVLVPIENTMRSQHRRRLSEHFGRIMSDSATRQAYSPLTLSTYSLVRHGDMIYLRPADVEISGGSDTFDLHCDAVVWADTYASDADTDFFLTYGESFILFRGVVELNLFLKDSEQVQVSTAAMKDAWEALISCDTMMLKNVTSDFNLQ